MSGLVRALEHQVKGARLIFHGSAVYRIMVPAGNWKLWVMADKGERFVGTMRMLEGVVGSHVN